MTDEDDTDYEALIDALVAAGATFYPPIFTQDVDENGKPVLRWTMPVTGVKFNPRHEARLSNE